MNVRPRRAPLPTTLHIRILYHGPKFNLLLDIALPLPCNLSSTYSSTLITCRSFGLFPRPPGITLSPEF